MDRICLLTWGVEGSCKKKEKKERKKKRKKERKKEKERKGKERKGKERKLYLIGSDGLVNLGYTDFCKGPWSLRLKICP